jgi:hypothetical protein
VPDDLAHLGALLLALTQHSHGNFLLIRRGLRKGPEPRRLEWRVSVSVDGIIESFSVPQDSLAGAMARALQRFA